MACPGGIRLVPSPAKRSKFIDLISTCLICQIRDHRDNLTCASAQGKKTLFECMKARADDDDELFSLCQANNIIDNTGIATDVLYHRKCYQSYTSKENISRRKRPLDDDNSPQPGSSCDSRQFDERVTRKSVQPYSSNKCIFCNCGKKRGDSKLYQVRTTDIWEKIEKAAEVVNDAELLIKVQNQDLIALDAKYHKNCLAVILMKADCQEKNPLIDDDSDIFTSSFQKLIDDVDQPMKEGKAYELTELLEVYRNYLTEGGYQNSSSYRSEKLKKRLQNHYGNALTFHQPGPANKSELVYSSTLDIRETINKIANFQAQVSAEAVKADFKLAKDNFESLSFFHTATVLHSSAKQIPGISTNPCVDNKDICSERADSLVPDNLYDFLAQVMMGKIGHETKKNFEEHRRVLAVAQDIIYAATKSRCKTPKHVGIAMAVHHLTKSRQLLDMLHSQGHSLSYDDVCRIETATASVVVSSLSQGDTFVPSNINSGTFLHAAMDNIDINEDTRSDTGTTHVLGSLLYQDKEEHQSGTFGPKQQATDVRSRTVETLKCLDILNCPNKFAKGIFQHLTKKVNVGAWFATYNSSLNRDWVFTRLCPTNIFTLDFEPVAANEQTMPGWGGFNAILQYTAGEERHPTSIGYNPVVPGLPTNADTLYTGLKMIEQQMKTLGQDTPVVTLDLQLYIIAQEIRYKNWDELKHFVLRLGGFHIMELYWKILGKRFTESGLDDLLVEAGIFGPNAASMIMQGKHYKRCTLAHKLMFEAMGMLKWQAFFHMAC